MPARAKSATPETVKALLDTLRPRPRVSIEAVRIYCAKAGRKFTDAGRLRDHLKKLGV